MQFLGTVVLGFTINVLAWWTVQVLLRPRLAVSTVISRRLRSGTSDKYVYRIKVANLGHRVPFLRSDAVNISTDAYFSIGGYIPDKAGRPGNRLIIKVPLGVDRIVLLRKGANRLLQLDLEAALARATGIRAEDAVILGMESTPLNRWFNITSSDNWLRVVVSAEHRFSGLRRTWVSEYRDIDITDRPFRRKTVDPA